MHGCSWYNNVGRRQLEMPAAPTLFFLAEIVLEFFWKRDFDMSLDNFETATRVGGTPEKASK